MKTFLLSLGLLLVAALLVWSVQPQGARLKDWEALRQPRLRSQADLAMLVVEAKGDPAQTSQQAFSQLFKAYFALPGAKGYRHMDAPRARWSVPNGLDPATWEKVPASQWTGLFALPAPAGLTRLPEAALKGALPTRLETWRYGTVAEILHVGPYDAERPSIDLLQQFIRAQGYVIAGPHEEEYLKGPGLFWRGNPARYLTLIRYPVKRAGR